MAEAFYKTLTTCSTELENTNTNIDTDTDKGTDTDKDTDTHTHTHTNSYSGPFTKHKNGSVGCTKLDSFGVLSLDFIENSTFAKP